jgi:GDPmannose 4,6-dehydratase
MTNTKRALITGVTGQDGAYLSKLLLEKGYEVYGTARRGASEKFSWLEFLNVLDNINIIDFDLLEFSNIQKTIQSIMVFNTKS